MNVHGPAQVVDEFPLVVVVGAAVVVVVAGFPASVTLTVFLGAVPPFPFTTRDRTIVRSAADLFGPSLSLTFAVPLVQLAVTGLPGPPTVLVVAPVTYAGRVTVPPAADW